MMFCDVSWCSMMFYDVLWCSSSLMFYDVLWCSMMFYDVLRCSMMFYDVLVLWCFFNCFCMGSAGGRCNHWATEGEDREREPCRRPTFHPHSSRQVNISMSSCPIFLWDFVLCKWLLHQGGKGGVKGENCDLPPGIYRYCKVCSYKFVSASGWKWRNHYCQDLRPIICRATKD